MVTKAASEPQLDRVVGRVVPLPSSRTAAVPVRWPCALHLKSHRVAKGQRPIGPLVREGSDSASVRAGVVNAGRESVGPPHLSRQLAAAGAMAERRSGQLVPELNHQLVEPVEPTRSNQFQVKAQYFGLIRPWVKRFQRDVERRSQPIMALSFGDTPCLPGFRRLLSCEDGAEHRDNDGQSSERDRSVG